MRMDSSYPTFDFGGRVRTGRVDVCVLVFYTFPWINIYLTLCY